MNRKCLLPGIESCRGDGAKASDDCRFHVFAVRPSGAVLPDGSNPGMAVRVHPAVEVGANRITVSKAHGTQMFSEPVVQTAVRLTCIFHVTQGAGEDVNSVF